MSRKSKLEELEIVQNNIFIVEAQIHSKIEDTTYFKVFKEKPKDYEHNKEIRTKALAYWKRRYNRILKELQYPI